MNSGPDCVGWYLRRLCSAAKGQIKDPFAASMMVTPCLKGSVFEALMRRCAMCPRICTSENSNVVVGSNFVLCVEVYSETLRNPKNAVVSAAQSIILSS